MTPLGPPVLLAGVDPRAGRNDPGWGAGVARRGDGRWAEQSDRQGPCVGGGMVAMTPVTAVYTALTVRARGAQS